MGAAALNFRGCRFLTRVEILLGSANPNRASCAGNGAGDSQSQTNCSTCDLGEGVYRRMVVLV